VAAAAGAAASDPTQVTRVATAHEQRTTGQRPAVRPPASSKTTRRLTIALLAVAAVIAAGVAGVMLGDTKPEPVRQDTVQSQIEGMRGFVEQHR
jgi:hypothetical protein